MQAGDIVVCKFGDELLVLATHSSQNGMTECLILIALLDANDELFYTPLWIGEGHFK